MKRNELTRVIMALAAVVVVGAVIWSLLPAPRTVQLHITGLPDWGTATVRFGQQTASEVEPGVYEATVRTGDRMIQVIGGLGEPCGRCCFALRETVNVAFDSGKFTLNATISDCPTADYPTTRIDPGPVTIDGETAQLRRSLFVGEPISAALWDGEGGCGEAAVGCVTWLDAIRFANRLSITEGLHPAYYHDEAHAFPYGHRSGPVYWMRAADGWRLPTEVEWVRSVGAQEAWEWTWDLFAVPYAGVVLQQEDDGPRTARGPGRTARVAPGEDLGFRLVRDVPPPVSEHEGELVRPPRERP
ncbi:MAG: hypothetical protein ACI8RZ_007195 [Myxococcota bacterium]|jgi:hypothetical protein